MWLDLGLLLGLNFLLYLHSLVINNTFMVDFIWSGWPPILSYVIFLRLSPEETRTVDLNRLITVFPLIMVWGFRLTHNFLSRGGVGHEDWRYQDMRKQVRRGAARSDEITNGGATRLRMSSLVARNRTPTRRYDSRITIY